MNLETRLPLSTRPSLLQLLASLPAPVQNFSLDAATIKRKFVVGLTFPVQVSVCFCKFLRFANINV